MRRENKATLIGALAAAAVVGTVAIAGNVTLPNTFQANTPAVAAQVNANFQAVKTAVDDNHARISALEARACPTGTAPFAGQCVETTPRASSLYFAAAVVCANAGGDLCSGSTLYAACESPATFSTFGAPSGSSGEWAAGGPRTKYLGNGTTYQGDWAPVVNRQLIGATRECQWFDRPAINGTAVYVDETRAFRCCLPRR